MTTLSRISLRPYLHAQVRFCSVLVLEDEMVFAQEAGAGLPVEDAAVETGADRERAAFAVD
jgi:hypothetical protein